MALADAVKNPSLTLFEYHIASKNLYRRQAHSDEIPEPPNFEQYPYASFFKKEYAEAKIQSDNAPWFSSGNYGKGGKPSFYFRDTPNEAELREQSRNSPFGYRLTHGMAKDVYINEFTLRFPNSKLDLPTTMEVNQQIRIHLREIGYFKQARKCCGYRREQGESILLIYREGDGAKMYNTLTYHEPNYQALEMPANLNKDIIRVEAIDKYDYQIPEIGAFGMPNYYRISFWSRWNSIGNSYHVHPTRAIRWKNDDIDYDVYQQQSALRACFSELQILNMIIRGAGFAAHRWGIGIPAFFTKGITEKNRASFETKLGNPLLDDFWIIPSEQIAKIEMEGVLGQMLDLPRLADMVSEQIASVQQIPTPILLGRVAGVVEGSVVNERQYYSTLIREQAVENDFHRQFFQFDPFIQRLFKKHGIIDFEFDWGLRQEMTQEEKVQLDLNKASVAISYMNVLTYNEIREYLGACKLEDNVGFAKYCQKNTNMDADQIGNWVPNMGMFKQQVTRELIQTPEEEQRAEIAEQERELQTNAQLEKGINKPKNVNEMLNKDPGTKEAERRELKMEKKLAGGEQSSENDLQTIVKEMATKDIMNMIMEAGKIHSKSYIAKVSGCSPETVTKIMGAVESLLRKAKGESDAHDKTV